MKRTVVGFAAAAVAAVSYIAMSASAPDRPTGVAARDWIAVNDSIGIVLVSTAVAMRSEPALPEGQVLLDRSDTIQISPGGALLLKPPIGGYFMIKGAAGWSRLVVIEPVKGPADAG